MEAWLSWLEHTVHIREVVGSSPTVSTTCTIQVLVTWIFICQQVSTCAHAWRQIQTRCRKALVQVVREPRRQRKDGVCFETPIQLSAETAPLPATKKLAKWRDTIIICSTLSIKPLRLDKMLGKVRTRTTKCTKAYTVASTMGLT